jgi:hypothetical protein
LALLSPIRRSTSREPVTFSTARTASVTGVAVLPNR